MHLTPARALLATLPLAVPLLAAAHSPAYAAPDRRPAPVLDVVPKPASAQLGHGRFTLRRDARVVVSRARLRPVGRSLAADLRPATGYRLPVRVGHARPGDVVLRLGRSRALRHDTSREGYVLTVSRRRAVATARTAHGLFDAAQTLRQLLPPWADSRRTVRTRWTMPVVRIVDRPRYGYRSLGVDIARHFQTPAAVERLIDQASAYKLNTLRLHVSDDQAFRIVIDGFPRLTAIGGQGSVGTDGRTTDPGGTWTQQQYKAVVAYARRHFMSVVPEVDSPGHNNAIVMSEYADTANPLLDGHPQDINCTRNDPPQWNYTGAVGYSAMCPESANTRTIYAAVIKQLSAMSSSRYYDIGGDEVPSTTLSAERYAAFVNAEMPVVRAQGKTVLGWAEMAGAGTTPPPGSVAEYWNPASGASAAAHTARDAVAKKMKVVMAPATHAYLDQQYANSGGTTIPAHIGLHWACSTGCDLDQFYDWDPGSYVDGVTDRDVIGVEGALWGETTRNLTEIDYLVMPRLLAIAELGWSPKQDRTSATGPAFTDFTRRVAVQGTRLTTAGTNFYPTPQVGWRLDAAAGTGRLLASVSAPGVPADAVTARVSWGDGTTSTLPVTGAAATSSSVNGVYSVAGNHRYHRAGAHHVTVRVSVPGRGATLVRRVVRSP